MSLLLPYKPPRERSHIPPWKRWKIIFKHTLGPRDMWSFPGGHSSYLFLRLLLIHRTQQICVSNPLAALSKVSMILCLCISSLWTYSSIHFGESNLDLRVVSIYIYLQYIIKSIFVLYPIYAFPSSLRFIITSSQSRFLHHVSGVALNESTLETGKFNNGSPVT